jgi:hypothetical protein
MIANASVDGGHGEVSLEALIRELKIKALLRVEISSEVV